MRVFLLTPSTESAPPFPFTFFVYQCSNGSKYDLSLVSLLVALDDEGVPSNQDRRLVVARLLPPKNLKRIFVASRKRKKSIVMAKYAYAPLSVVRPVPAMTALQAVQLRRGSVNVLLIAPHRTSSHLISSPHNNNNSGRESQ
jgi:hypothetical protein